MKGQKKKVTQAGFPESGLSEADWNRRIEGLPVPATRLISAAASALDKRNLAGARTALIGALALAPEHAEVMRLQGVLNHLEGRHAEAESMFRRALTRNPDDALIQTNLGSSLRAQGDVEGALEAFARACELDPALAAAWFNLAKALKSQARIDDAYRASTRAVELAPAHISARLLLGDISKAMGDIEAAARSYREVLRRSARNAQAWFSLANLKTEPFNSPELDQLRRLARDPNLSEDDRVALGFAEVKALEDHARYPEAHAALVRVNALKRKRLAWDAQAFSARVDRIAAAFRLPPPFQADARQGSEVIFVVSMPRSGSTLTEQILASHSEVEGASELPDLPAVIAEESRRRGIEYPGWVAEATEDDWNRMGRAYLQRTERWRTVRSRFTDKGLYNWQFAGAALAMLPAARIVVCRRDPAETCLSCFHQLFARGQEFSYDLDDLVAYWRDFDRLCRLLKEQCPSRVFDMVYENLLANPMGSTVELLGFCGLPFEDSCLRFHESRRAVRTASAAQVRQPLRADTSRSTNYGDALIMLRDILGRC